MRHSDDEALTRALRGLVDAATPVSEALYRREVLPELAIIHLMRLLEDARDALERTKQ